MDDLAQSAPVPRIAIADADPVRSRDVATILAHGGFVAAWTAASGEEALVRAGDDAPEVLLMAMDLAHDLKGSDPALLFRDRHGIPVVYLIPRTDAEALERIALTGAQGYCCLPVTDRELIATVRLALGQGRRDKQQRERERWLTLSLGNLAEGVLAADASGRIRLVNGVAEALLGLGESRILGRDLDDIYHIRSEAEGFAVPGEGGDRELVLLEGAEGRLIPVEHNVSEVVDAAGIPVGTVAVFREISHRLAVRRELRDSLAQLRCALEATVNALTVTSEKRDPFTAGHQERVARLAFALAEVLGLPPVGLEGIRMAGLVHDIGKIHVPSEILAKPAGLSPMERGVVREHCEVGYAILKDIPFPWPVARMVLEHHERFDGSGYPAGLTAGDTLIESRILAVADVVEAMHSHRPYRAALGRDAALEEICAGRGVLYDPDVVDACLLLFERDNFQF